MCDKLSISQKRRLSNWASRDNNQVNAVSTTTTPTKSKSTKSKQCKPKQESTSSTPKREQSIYRTDAKPQVNVTRQPVHLHINSTTDPQHVSRVLAGITNPRNNPSHWLYSSGNVGLHDNNNNSTSNESNDYESHNRDVDYEFEIIIDGNDTDESNHSNMDNDVVHTFDRSKYHQYLLNFVYHSNDESEDNQYDHNEFDREGMESLQTDIENDQFEENCHASDESNFESLNFKFPHKIFTYPAHIPDISMDFEIATAKVLILYCSRATVNSLLLVKP